MSFAADSLEPLHGSASNEDGVFYYLSPKDRPIQGSNGSRVHHWVNFDVQNLRRLSLISKDTLDQAGPDDEGWEDVWAFQRDAEFSRPKGSRRGMPTWRSEARLPSRDLSQARSSGDGCSESLEIRQEVPPSGSIDSPWTGRRPGEAKQGQRLSRDRGPSHSGAQIYRDGQSKRDLGSDSRQQAKTPQLRRGSKARAEYPVDSDPPQEFAKRVERRRQKSSLGHLQLDDPNIKGSINLGTSGWTDCLHDGLDEGWASAWTKKQLKTQYGRQHHDLGHWSNHLKHGEFHKEGTPLKSGSWVRSLSPEAEPLQRIRSTRQSLSKSLPSVAQPKEKDSTYNKSYRSFRAKDGTVDQARSHLGISHDSNWMMPVMDDLKLAMANEELESNAKVRETLRLALKGRPGVKEMVDRLMMESKKDKIRQELRHHQSSIENPAKASKVSSLEPDDADSSTTSSNRAMSANNKAGGSKNRQVVLKNPMNRKTWSRSRLSQQIMENDTNCSTTDIYKDLVNLVEQQRYEDYLNSKRLAPSEGCPPPTPFSRSSSSNLGRDKGFSNLSSETSWEAGSTGLPPRSRHQLDRMSAYNGNRHAFPGSDYPDRYRNNQGGHHFGGQRHHHRMMSSSRSDTSLMFGDEDSSITSRISINPDMDEIQQATPKFNVHSKQSHFFNSLFPSRANRFGYPVYPEKDFGISTLRCNSGPVSFAGFCPPAQSHSHHPFDYQGYEAPKEGLQAEESFAGSDEEVNHMSILSVVPKLFKARISKQIKENSKTKKNGRFFNLF